MHLLNLTIHITQNECIQIIQSDCIQPTRTFVIRNTQRMINNLRRLPKMLQESVK